MVKKAINIIWFFFILFQANGQNLQMVERDTIYLEEFLGIEKVQYYMEDTLFVKQGNYDFISQLYNQLLSNSIRKLQIKGKYQENRFHGQWEYKLSDLDLDIKSLTEGSNMGLEYYLNGIERSAKFNYLNGIPEGNWMIEVVTVKDNKRLPETNGGNFTFKDGIAVGEFKFDDLQGKNFLRGNLNDEGFFDGDLILRYIYNGDEIKESRVYRDGFLIKLNKFNETEGTLDVDIVYEDVVQKLEDSDGQIQEINFRISEEGFGVLFQNGYTMIDEKLIEQVEGNSILDNIFYRFNRFSEGLTDEREGPTFKLTRRFKFVYPEEEERLIRSVQPRLNIMLDEYNDFLSNAKFILNRDRIDSLPYIFGFIDHARRKAQDMLDVIELTEEGFFDFLYRPNYYPNGLPNLNQSDSFTYEEAGEEKEAKFDLGIYVDSPYRIMEQMEAFTDTLKQQTDEYLDYSYMEISIFDEQATIDSLDNQIVQLKVRADALYSFLQVIPEDRTFEEMPLDYRIYRVIHNNTLQRLQNEYLDAEDYDQKVGLGVELTCMFNYLIEQHDEILFIENMPERLDREFTRFSPNPFFERDIETKILPAIYGKGTGPLFNAYAENLFESRNCKDLQNNLEKFRKLENRLKELVKRSDTEEVVRLDRALRRENIPSRIERLLNL